MAKAKGSPIHVTLPLDDVVSLGRHAANRTQATGKAQSPQDVGRELIRFALAHVRKCLACGAGLPCEVHAPKEPEAEPTSGKPVEGWQAMIDCYHDCHVAAGRGKPTFSGADMAAFKKLVEACGGAAKAIDIIKGALAADFCGSWITIQDLAKNPGRGQTANGKKMGQATTTQRKSEYRPDGPKP